MAGLVREGILGNEGGDGEGGGDLSQGIDPWTDDLSATGITVRT